MPDPNLSLLANLSFDFLNDTVYEGISTPVQNLNPNSQVPNVDVEIPTKEENPAWDCN